MMFREAEDLSASRGRDIGVFSRNGGKGENQDSTCPLPTSSAMLPLFTFISLVCHEFHQGYWESLGVGMKR